jgi:putative DNA primase/helicase
MRDDADTPLDPTRNCTLEMYAAEKCLPIEFLRGLGLQTVPSSASPGGFELEMPYPRPDGTLHRIRRRLTLYQNEDLTVKRFAWGKGPGEGVTLYGRDRVPSEGIILIVEGESDCHTAWHLGFHALGAPGATNFKPERDDVNLEGLEPIAIIEPGPSGQAFLGRLAKSAHANRIRAIALCGFKDISELYKTCPERARARIEMAIAAAIPLKKFPKQQKETTTGADDRTTAGTGSDDKSDTGEADGKKAKDKGAAEKEKSEPGDTPPLSDDEFDDEIARLAKLPPRTYEREREAAAKKLGLRVARLDKLVKVERDEGGDTPGQGRPLELPEHELWPAPVDGAALLDALSRNLRTYVIMTAHEADAAALWQLGTHVYDAFPAFPRLVWKSAEPVSGKTTALNLTKSIVARPLKAENVTASSLFRAIELSRPTLLLDEVDNLRLGENQDILSILNSGHGAGGSVIRTVGDSYEPREFGTFCPVALGGIGDLPGPLTTRSIFIRLKRKLRSEPVARFRADRPPPLLAELGSKCARWAADNRERLRDADPCIPEMIGNRDADNWAPLFAIADAAGGKWPELARKVALAICKADAADDKASIRLQALADIRSILSNKDNEHVFLAPKDGPAIFSKGLAAALAAIEGRPWAEFGKAQRPITPNTLAKLLTPIGVKSRGSIRHGTRTDKGYLVSDFGDAFERFLPPLGGDPPVTRHKSWESRDSEPNAPVTPDGDVTGENPLNPATRAGCDGVTGGIPGEGQKSRESAWEAEI